MARVFLLLLAVLAVAGCGESRANRWRRLAGDAVPLASPLMVEGTYRNQATGRPALLLWNQLNFSGTNPTSLSDDSVQLGFVDGELRIELLRDGMSCDSIALPVVVRPDRLEVPRRTKAHSTMVVLNSVAHVETDLGANADGGLVMVSSGGGAAIIVVLPADVGSGEFAATFERVAAPQAAGGP